MKKKIGLFTLLICSIAIGAYAQVRNVKGVALKPNDVPVVSAHTGRLVTSGITSTKSGDTVTVYIGEAARLVSVTNGVKLEVFSASTTNWVEQVVWTED